MSAHPISRSEEYPGGDLLLQQQQSLDEIQRIASMTPRLAFEPRSSFDRTLEEDLKQLDASIPGATFWTKSVIIAVSIAVGVGLIIGVPLGYITY